MSFNVEKCHQQTVTKKRNRIPTSYTLYNQTFERLASAKYFGVELTKILLWGKHFQSNAAKPDEVSAFAYRNLKGCLLAVQTHCYKGLVHQIMLACA